uniref:Peptidase S1 domain-containing protein n=1 Tax=Panagrellus redivivus TaxID=6233 RepID=A0A7E4W705_PANRE
MFRFLQISALACVITIVACKLPCGNSPGALKKYHDLDPHDSPTHFKVLNGEVPNAHIFPFTAHIRFKQQGMSFCTASIIGSRYILSAAHCYFGVLKMWVNSGKSLKEAEKLYLQNFDVGYGSVDSKRSIHDAIEEVFVTEDSDIEEYEDILILKLKHKIKFNRNARPVCLSADIEPKVGKDLIITGFGNHSTGPNSYVKMEKYVVDTIPIVKMSECRETKEHSFCAGGLERGTMGGDSGGPMYAVHKSHFYQLGVVAKGATDVVKINGEEYRDDRALYTKVGDFCDFIEDVTEGDAVCRDLF